MTYLRNLYISQLLLLCQLLSMVLDHSFLLVCKSTLCNLLNIFTFPILSYYLIMINHSLILITQQRNFVCMNIVPSRISNLYILALPIKHEERHWYLIHCFGRILASYFIKLLVVTLNVITVSDVLFCSQLFS